MNTYSINYDLKQPGRDYSGLYRAIKDLGAWWHNLESTWLVATRFSADEVWKRLETHIDANDRMLIIKVSKPIAGWLPKAAWDWIHEHVGW